jgi:prepilin-type N-terminal cleavage/methylation domain-containing protein
MKLINKTGNKGFTLVELLVVIAVLGVLATVLLIAINPGEQLARGRDTGRKQTLAQIAHAIQAYYTAHNGTYPADAGWFTTLTTDGDLPAAASVNLPAYSAGGGCTLHTVQALGQTPACYFTNGAAPYSAATVYVKMESNLYSGGTCGAGVLGWFTYSTTDNRTGIVCGAENTVGLSNANYL